jgi:hypothetical protein
VKSEIQCHAGGIYVYCGIETEDKHGYFWEWVFSAMETRLYYDRIRQGEPYEIRLNWGVSLNSWFYVHIHKNM